MFTVQMGDYSSKPVLPSRKEEGEKEFQGKEKSERFKAQKECNPVLLFEDGGAV